MQDKSLAWVSILSQPEGRELHITSFFTEGSSMFQSSPSPKAGSYRVYLVQFPFFQLVSILSQPEGRELRLVEARLKNLDGVSILSQPEGRELQLEARRIHTIFLCFNPLPARRPGAT